MIHLHEDNAPVCSRLPWALASVEGQWRLGVVKLRKMSRLAIRL